MSFFRRFSFGKKSKQNLRRIVEPVGSESPLNEASIHSSSSKDFSERIHYAENKQKNVDATSVFGEIVSSFENSVGEALPFHQSIPSYQETPLRNLSNLANHLNIERLWVKDESVRFGLNANKVLGISYFICHHLMDESDTKESLEFDKLKEVVHDKEVTFVTASRNDFGYCLAHISKLLDAKCVVYVPNGTQKEILQRSENCGATVHETNADFDESLSLARKEAEENGWIVVQENVFDSKLKANACYIGQGFCTVLSEIFFGASGGPCMPLPSPLPQPALARSEASTYIPKGATTKSHPAEHIPTHIFLAKTTSTPNCHVSLFTAAVAYFLTHSEETFERMPFVGIVEARNDSMLFSANYKSENPDDASGPDVSGALGSECLDELEWEMVKNSCDAYFSVSEHVITDGINILQNPRGDDKPLSSGIGCGMTMGLVNELLLNDQYSEIQNSINLNSKSRVLVFLTEDDTDFETYEKLIMVEADEQTLRGGLAEMYVAIARESVAEKSPKCADALGRLKSLLIDSDEHIRNKPIFNTAQEIVQTYERVYQQMLKYGSH